MKSRIVKTNGIPEIEVEGKIINTNAYVTYFTENETYADFTSAGYDLYSICTYFTILPINEDTGFTGARSGIFEHKNAPDYSEFDNDMALLLKKNPNAMVFPRIYISMPLWWVKENPKECIVCGVTPEGREMMFSDKFLSDGGELLRQFIRHAQSMPYANNIIGYQVSGGTTQEWFHFGRDGSFCENAFPYFKRYMAENHPSINVDFEDFMARKYEDFYVDFSNDSAADTVEYFSKVAKEECGFNQIIGTFYGYSVEVQMPLGGTHSLSRIIDSPYVDFICSPVSYAGVRSLGEDWVTMLPEDSLKLHGKMYVAEADIRTFLSRFPDECREDIILTVPYRSPIWLGGPTEELSICQIRKPFAKLLTRSRGSWWFDMWGGWYASEKLMEELKLQKQISDLTTKEVLSTKHKAAVIIDEKMYKHHPYDDCQRRLCIKLSSSGILYDMFLLTDLDRIKADYDLFFMPFPDSDKYVLDGKVCITDADADFDTMHQAAKKANVPIWIETPDVFYCGNGFLALHAKDEGLKTVTLPINVKITPLTPCEFSYSDGKLTFPIKKYETVIFRIENYD